MPQYRIVAKVPGTVFKYETLQKWKDLSIVKERGWFSNFLGASSLHILLAVGLIMLVAYRCQPMRPKARGLAQHDGPLGWLEESDPAGGDFERDGRSLPPSLTDHTICSGDDLSPLYTKHCHELRHVRKAWPGALVDPYLLSGVSHN